MSTASDNKVEVDTERLKSMIADKGFSFRKTSEGIGHNASWLTQRIGKKGKFFISRNDALRIAEFLSCGVQDFRASSENVASPIIIDCRGKFLNDFDRMPANQYPLVWSFFEYISSANEQKLAELECFLKGRSTFSLEPQFSLNPNLDSTHWFQNYIESETHIIFHKKMCEYLKTHPVIPDENSLHDMVNRKRQEAERKVHKKEEITAKTIELVDTYPRKEIFGASESNSYPLDLESIIGNTVNSVIRSYAQFLVHYFCSICPPNAHIVSAMKEQLKNIEKDVTRSSKL